MSDARLVVLVTAGCHLCDDAIKIIAPVATELGIPWESRDLMGEDDATITQWREFVPVVLIDGAVHDVFRVSADRLRVALT